MTTDPTEPADLPARARQALWRAGTVGVLLVAFLVQFRRQWEVIREGSHPFLIGDWLISYEAGFIRRGLFGALLELVAPAAQDGLIVLFAVQTGLYAVIFGVVLTWALRLPGPHRWAALLLSPAFLIFGLNAFQGTHRKEIIVLAGLLLLAEAVWSGRRVGVALAVALVLMLVGVLSHDANALLVVPFLVLVRWAAGRTLIGPGAARRASFGFVFIAGLGLIGALAAPGTVDQQQAVCVDLVARGFDAEVCRGAISYLGESLSGQVSSVAATLPRSLLYVVTAVFALAPFTMSDWARANRWTLVLAVLPLVPLFVVALDWGRWLMLAVVLATVLTVVGSSQDGDAPRPLPLPFLLVFVNGWSLPHFAISIIDMGQGELLRTLRDVLRVMLNLVRG